jgi:hypothetical protein
MKGIGKMGIILVIGIVAVGLFAVGMPQVVSGWVNQIQGILQNCNIDPYNALCTCDPNQRKIDVPWIGVPRWHCENLQELILDPESPTFGTDAISFTQEYLRRECGNLCTDLSCGQPCFMDGASDIPIDGSNRCMTAVYGYGDSGARVVDIECRVVDEYIPGTPGGCTSHTECGSWEHCVDGECVLPKSGYSPWRMFFFVESATGIPLAHEFMDNYCVNPELTERCEPYVEIIPYNQLTIIPFNIKTGYPAPA